MTAILVGSGAVLLLAATVVAVLRKRIVVVSVSGSSMAPTLRPGDRVLVRRVRGETPRPGEVVVVAEPGPCRPGDPTGARGSRWVVKRVAAVPGDPEPPFMPAWARTPEGVVAPGRLVLLGDNPELSRDSRQFGTVRADRVLGVALRRLGGGQVSSSHPPAWE